MLVMNMSFTFSAHYCGGKAVKSSFSFIPGDLSCGMTQDEKTTQCEINSQEPNISKKNCCEDKHFTFQITEEYNNNEFNLTNVEIVPVFLFIPQTSILPLSIPVERNSTIGYSPPEIVKEVSIFFQVFRL